ncbi:MAG TPA: hypothetical protein VL854_01340 [Nitrososphaeraceae archaeon]|nr:hypothetical protein [Nitrososphaeraceae archaeon]
MKGRNVNKTFCSSTIPLTDMQMPLVEKAIRSYVKVGGDKAYLREVKYLIPNTSIGEALETIGTPIDLDKDFLEQE